MLQLLGSPLLFENQHCEEKKRDRPTRTSSSTTTTTATTLVSYCSVVHNTMRVSMRAHILLYAIYGHERERVFKGVPEYAY